MINIVCDTTAAPPTIAINLATDDELATLRTLFEALATGEKRSVLINDDGRFQAPSEIRLRLERNEQTHRHAAKISMVGQSNGVVDFLWKQSAEQWKEDLRLLEGFSKEWPGHHYLTGEELDDAEVVVSYCES